VRHIINAQSPKIKLWRVNTWKTIHGEFQDLRERRKKLHFLLLNSHLRGSQLSKKRPLSLHWVWCCCCWASIFYTRSNNNNNSSRSNSNVWRIIKIFPTKQRRILKIEYWMNASSLKKPKIKSRKDIDAKKNKENQRLKCFWLLFLSEN